MSYISGQEKQLWSIYDQIVAHEFHDRDVQWEMFEQVLDNLPGANGIRKIGVRKAELTPGSVGFDLDGYVFRQASCGHGTNLRSNHEPDAMWARPCPLNQIVGPVKTSKGHYILWIHERWYEQTSQTGDQDRQHWKNLHEFLQSHVESAPYYGQLVQEQGVKGAFQKQMAQRNAARSKGEL